MPFATCTELRWSRQISISNANCKIDYRELEQYLTITRCYAINRDIDGDCPGSMCHSASLAQRNLPATRKKTNKGLSNEQVLRRRVGIFYSFYF